MSIEVSEVSFSDQCHLLCLGYLQNISINDSDYDKDDSKILNETVTSKIDSLNLNLNGNYWLLVYCLLTSKPP